MKQFIDLHLRVPLKDLSKTQKMIWKASELGYKKVSIPFPPHTSKEQINQTKQICTKIKIDFVPRVNFFPKNSNELLNNLRHYRRKFEIIAVRCQTKDVA